MCAVIETIIAVKENFKADYIIDILLGKETTEVLVYHRITTGNEIPCHPTKTAVRLVQGGKNENTS